MTDREFAKELRAIRAERLRLAREVASMQAEKLVSDVLSRVLEALLA